MALYLVTYDIDHTEEDDRYRLRKALEMGAWAQVAESSYVIQRQNSTAKGIYQALNQLLSSPAVALYVFQVAEDFCGSGRDQKVQNWVAHARENYPHGI